MKKILHARQIVICLLLLLSLISCVPREALITGSQGEYSITFSNLEDTLGQFALVVLGKIEEIDDGRCELASQGYTCNLGILESGQSIQPVSVKGKAISCDVYRIPNIKLYPCTVKESE